MAAEKTEDPPVDKRARNRCELQASLHLDAEQMQILDAYVEAVSRTAFEERDAALWVSQFGN